MSYCPDGGYKNHIEVAHSYCNKLLVLCSHTQHRRKGTRLDLATGEKLSHAKCIKILQLMVHGRCGQLINSVGFMCLHASKCLSILTMKYWLFYPSVHSLSLDNAMERKKKETAWGCSQFTSSWGSFSRNNFEDPREIFFVPPLFRWAWSLWWQGMTLRKFAFPVWAKKALA